jgi:hypothetical protein
VDLSHPDNNSVNDGIDPLHCSLVYITVENAAQMVVRLGRGTLLAKLDIQSAYRIVPVHPADRALLGMRWRGKLYIDKVLPFGLRSAPKIFNAIADAIEWCMYNRGVNLCQHLFIGRPGGGESAVGLQQALAICAELGVPVAPKKVHGPNTTLEVLGIIIDTLKMELRLPANKLQRLQRMIHQWARRKICTKRQLLSIIGHLSHACKVKRPGRPFLRQLIELSTCAKELHHHLRLNIEIRSDLHWWKVFLSRWNGVGLMSPLVEGTPDFTVTFDASGSWGCGTYWQEHWFSIPWGACWSSIHITVKELLPIIVASALWGRQWQGKRIRFRCDNAAVVAIVNSGRSKHPWRCITHAFYTYLGRVSTLPSKQCI